MATANDIATAIAVIKEIGGNPDVGAVKDLITLLETSTAPVKENRVVAVAEKR